MTKDENIIYYIKKHYSELQAELKVINNSFENFLNNLIIQKAIKMDLLQIGELFGSLSEGLKNKLPKSDIKGIVDIRNFLAHGYTQIDNKILWLTIQNDLPRLMNQLN